MASNDSVRLKDFGLIRQDSHMPSVSDDNVLEITPGLIPIYFPSVTISSTRLFKISKYFWSREAHILRKVGWALVSPKNANQTAILLRSQIGGFKSISIKASNLSAGAAGAP